MTKVHNLAKSQAQNRLRCEESWKGSQRKRDAGEGQDERSTWSLEGTGILEVGAKQRSHIWCEAQFPKLTQIVSLRQNSNTVFRGATGQVQQFLFLLFDTLLSCNIALRSKHYWFIRTVLSGFYLCDVKNIPMRPGVDMQKLVLHTDDPGSIPGITYTTEAH